MIPSVTEDLICGLIDPNKKMGSQLTSSRIRLAQFFAQHGESRIFAVLEPHEFGFDQGWASLGLQSPPENVPLTRLPYLVQQLFSGSDADSRRHVIFVCRSGIRSGQAAEALGLLGIENVWHLAGGIVLGDTVNNGVSANCLDLEYVI